MKLYPDIILAIGGISSAGSVALGCLLALGLGQFSKRVPKGHRLTRQVGIGYVLLGIGFGAFCAVNQLLFSELSVLRVVLIIASMIPVTLGSRLMQSTMRDIRTFTPAKQSEP